MPINDEIRTAGEALLEQGRAAMVDARRPLLAVVGAGELAVSGLRAQLRDLPATGDQVRRLSTRAGELRGRVQDRLHGRLPDLDAASVRANVEGYLSHARSVYQSLADRGEQVVARRAPKHRGTPAPLSGATGAETAGGNPVGRDPGDGAGQIG